MTDYLEKIKDPSNNATPGSAKNLTPEQAESLENSGVTNGSVGDGTGSLNTDVKLTELIVNPVSQENVNEFRLSSHLLSRRARSLLANSLSHDTGERDPVISRLDSGSMLNIDAVARRLANPTSDEPMFDDMIPGNIRPARKQIAMDRIIFAVDGSGSMDSKWKQVQQFLFVCNEVFTAEKIPMATAINKDDATLTLHNTEGLDKVARHLLGYAPNGSRNMACASLIRLAGNSMNANKPASMAKTRLVIISDCDTVDSDVDFALQGYYNIPFPSMILAFADEGKNTRVTEISSRFSDIAHKRGKTHSTIQLNPSNDPNDPVYLGAFKSFCEWCRNPVEFERKNKGVVHAVPAPELATLTRPVSPLKKNQTTRNQGWGY